MKKEVDISKVLFPEKDVLKEDEDGTITATIVDEELDPFECRFNYDGCVQIETEGYSHIALSIEQLYQLIGMIQNAEAKYAEREY
jgi:hypothetical protein